MSEPCVFCGRPSTTYDDFYDDFYGELCDEHWELKVNQAVVNPWTGKPR